MDRIVTACAVFLPLSLGLGLIYLTINGDIELITALVVLGGIAVVVPMAAAIGPLTRDESSPYYLPRPGSKAPRE